MSEKSKSTAFLLCYVFGFLGAHRFYVKRWKTGVLMLLTLGGLSIWWLIDLVLIMGGKLTDHNGDELRTGPPDPDNPHAGFWVRTAAISVDLIIVYLISGVISIVAMFALGFGALAMTTTDPQAIAAMAPAITVALTLVSLAVIVLYFGLQTASRHQATVGKRIFEIHVESASGEPVGLLRGVWRSLCYVLSGLPIYLGFLIAAFTSNKRALHDYLAGTKVLYGAAGSVTAAQPRSIPKSARGSAQVASAATHATISSSDSARSAAQHSAGASNAGAKISMLLGAVLLAAAAALALL